MQLIYKFIIGHVCALVTFRLQFFILFIDSRKGPFITRNKVTISIEKAEISKFTVSNSIFLQIIR